MQTYRFHAHSHVPQHHLGKYAVGMAITFVVVQIPSLGHVLISKETMRKYWLHKFQGQSSDTRTTSSRAFVAFTGIGDAKCALEVINSGFLEVPVYWWMGVPRLLWPGATVLKPSTRSPQQPGLITSQRLSNHYLYKDDVLLQQRMNIS